MVAWPCPVGRHCARRLKNAHAYQAVVGARAAARPDAAEPAWQSKPCCRVPKLIKRNEKPLFYTLVVLTAVLILLSVMLTAVVMSRARVLGVSAARASSFWDQTAYITTPVGARTSGAHATVNATALGPWMHAVCGPDLCISTHDDTNTVWRLSPSGVLSLGVGEIRVNQTSLARAADGTAVLGNSTVLAASGLAIGGESPGAHAASSVSPASVFAPSAIYGSLHVLSDARTKSHLSRL